MAERQSFGIGYGPWFRFSRYEVRDGYVRPAEGAEKIRYDPWKLYGEGDAPYMSIDRLIGSTDNPFTELNKEKITDWCSKYGLLGVLLHQTHVAVMAPDVQYHKEQPQSIVQQRYVRIRVREFSNLKQLGWTVATDFEPINLSKKGKNKIPLGSIASRSKWDSPHAIVRGHANDPTDRPEMRKVSLGKAWAPYFPGIGNHNPNTYQYPLPLGPGFWESYAEPLDVFIRNASLLRDAIDQLTQHRAGKTKEMGALNDLISQVQIALVFPKAGSATPVWRCPSLLTSLALMAYLDQVNKGLSLARCASETCDTLYTTSSKAGRYCSVRCRQREEKRRQRARK